MSDQSIETAGPKRLRRVLGLWDLIFYGIVLIQPIAAIGLFGIASKVSHGHMVTTLFIAMLGMMITAVSYGRMASLYPSAGSAYTYVGNGLNPYFGFMAGWAMFLDYLIVPIINTVYAALTLQRLMPSVPFFVWVVLFVFVITFLNLRGIRTMARSNEILLFIMCVVILIFIWLGIRYVFHAQGWGGLLSYKPFYDPATFDIGAVMTATSFAALTYIGFDGVTTLAEDVKNPKRNMLLAPILVCLFTGVFSGLQIYLAQRIWPDYNTFANPETAFFDVAALVGGKFLFQAMAAILFIACLGSGLAGQVGAARLLFGMGRDGVIPGKIFSHLDARSGTPTYNIIIMAVLTIAGSIALSYQGAAELLNFGAFIAFMGVNIAAFRQFFFLRPAGQKRNIFMDAVLPVSGFIVCFLIWIALPTPAKVIGGIWFIIGLVYLIIKTRGLKQKPIVLDFKDL
ncbi:MAG TPA: APC family permease [Puia sp.]